VEKVSRKKVIITVRPHVFQPQLSIISTLYLRRVGILLCGSHERVIIELEKISHPMWLFSTPLLLPSQQPPFPLMAPVGGTAI
jgi:hypothetical protein